MQDPRQVGLGRETPEVPIRDYRKATPPQTYSRHVAERDIQRVARYLRFARLLHTISPNEHRRRHRRATARANRELARRRGLAYANQG